MLESPPTNRRLDINVLNMDTPMVVEPRIRNRETTIDNDIRPSKKLKFVPPANLDEEFIEEPVVQVANIDRSPVNLAPLLQEMKLRQRQERKVLIPKGGLKKYNKPWGNIIFRDSFTGPMNDMPPFSVAVREGNLAIYSWEHDWLISQARGDVQLQTAIDNRYLEQIRSIENELNPYTYSLITNSIQYGAPIYYKIRKMLWADEAKYDID